MFYVLDEIGDDGCKTIVIPIATRREIDRFYPKWLTDKFGLNLTGISEDQQC